MTPPSVWESLLISDEELRESAVAVAIAELVHQWPDRIAPAANPAAAAWEVVRHRIVRHADLLPPHNSAVHAVLTASDPGEADIALLAFSLHLNERAISDITGTDPAKISALVYRAAAAASPRGGQPATISLPFENFMNNWRDPFLGYTLTWCPDLGHAQDILVEASAFVHERWHTLHASHTPAAGAFRILQDTIENSLGCGHGPPERALVNALAALTDHDRVQADCLRLRHLVGLDYRRTSAVLGISLTAARTATWSAFRFLESHLDTPDRPRTDLP